MERLIWVRNKTILVYSDYKTIKLSGELTPELITLPNPIKVVDS